jgi:hypothetical protein
MPTKFPRESRNDETGADRHNPRMIDERSDNPLRSISRRRGLELFAALRDEHEPCEL